MSNTKQFKYKLNVSEQQLTKLYTALGVGSPLAIALTYAGISKSTYVLWTEIASIAKYCIEKEQMKNDLNVDDYGIDLKRVKATIEATRQASGNSRITIDSYKLPTEESVLRYKTNNNFKIYANQILEIIKKCDSLRSEIVLYHLTSIKEGSRLKGSNTNASQWFLERTLPDIYGKKEMDRPTEEELMKTKKVQIQFVDPKSAESLDRIRNMEREVEQQLGLDNKPKA